VKARSAAPSLTCPAPRDVWSELVDASPEALAFHTPSWIDALCASGRYEDASRLHETFGGEPLVVPLVRRRGVPRALAVEASLPYGWGFGGVLAAQPLHARDLTAVVAELAAERRLRLSLRPNPLLAPLWDAAASAGATRVPRTAHVLDLADGFVEVWERRFRGRTRTKVRKGEKSGLEIECDRAGALVDDFYGLYVRSVDRWARRSREPLALARARARRREPREKLARVARHLGEACEIWLARLEGRPVAGIVVLRSRLAASYWRGAMDAELAGPTCANYLLHARAIEAACQVGCRSYHMGETAPSSPLAQFKRSLGAREHAYAEYRFGSLPLGAPALLRRGTAASAKVRAT
jgi:Acetyltransferase (GNAT) domain